MRNRFYGLIPTGFVIIVSDNLGVNARFDLLIAMMSVLMLIGLCCISAVEWNMAACIG